ncbi:leucine-rich repeat-containing G-protein coupled receptor 5 [Trichonephila clavipes]|nr:leucine-rich repeat-containing G-protein coupled receptor 5 [Trichonephila clavipes]
MDIFLALGKEAKVFAIFVFALNSCANPFLYAIFTKQFKKDCIHICKRIEESRVTRGIGRGRHSSNFSNRQTPVTTNSAAAAATPGSDSELQRCRNFSTDICQCNKTLWKSKDINREGWKEWALKYCLCRRQKTNRNERDAYTYAIAQIQRNMDKRNKHTTSISSENFSSRSDSWRQATYFSRSVCRSLKIWDNHWYWPPAPIHLFQRSYTTVKKTPGIHFLRGPSVASSHFGSSQLNLQNDVPSISSSALETDRMASSPASMAISSLLKTEQKSGLRFSETIFSGEYRYGYRYHYMNS